MLQLQINQSKFICRNNIIKSMHSNNKQWQATRKAKRLLFKQLLFKVKKLLLCYIHLAAGSDINSNTDKIVQKSNKSLQSASGSHMNWN